MATAEVERRLAAIIVADVVGFSRLVEADEAQTLKVLGKLQSEVIDPLIESRHGRIVKRTGDGLIAEFRSVVDAVVCAISLQKETATHQSDIPQDRRIVFRVGINLGDVIVEGDDLLGDGVNIAARLEQACPSGGVLVSGTAFDHLQGKLDLPIDDAGELRVKNISRPVRAYSVRVDGVKRLPRRATRYPQIVSAGVGAIALLLLVGTGVWWARSPLPVDAKPTMIVLPFDNLSDDKEQGYLADGISADLTTELARVPGLLVLSRAAAFSYKGKSIKPEQAAGEMGVRYILEGSVRRTGDEMRINAQLIDASTGVHLWAERFDSNWQDVLRLQNQVVKNVAIALELRLAHGATDAAPGGTSNTQAYQEFLQGFEHELRYSPADFVEAVRHFKQAIALDPNYGHAWAELAWIYEQTAGDERFERVLGVGFLEAMKLASAALASAMRNPSAAAYQLVARRHINHWQFDLAIPEMQHAIALNPSDPWSYQLMAEAQILSSHPAEGLTFLQAASRVDPREDRDVFQLRGLAEFTLEDYSSAAASLEKSLRPGDNGYKHLLPLMAVYGQLGAPEKALKWRKELDDYANAIGDKQMTALLAMQVITFEKISDVHRFRDGLLQAGIPELPFDFDPKSSDRLTGEQMQTLLFGHRIAGRVLDKMVNAGTLQAKDFGSGVPFSLSVASDGSGVDYTWGNVADSGGGSHFVDGYGCFYHRETASCGVIFRNPAGRQEGQNEYYWIAPWAVIAFSVVN